MQTQEKAILKLEKTITDSKKTIKVLRDELEQKLQLKRLGNTDFKTENEALLMQVRTKLGTLDSTKKQDKKEIAALKKDATALEARLAKTDEVFAQIGGKLGDEEAKTLILKKLHDLATHELDRYLNASKRHLIQSVESLWDKYAVSSRTLETERTETLKVLDGFLTGLGYFK